MGGGGGGTVKKVTEACALGYSDFNDLIGFISKMLPYTILKISVCANIEAKTIYFCKKLRFLQSDFVRISHK